MVSLGLKPTDKTWHLKQWIHLQDTNRKRRQEQHLQRVHVQAALVISMFHASGLASSLDLHWQSDFPVDENWMSLVLPPRASSSSVLRVPVVAS